MLKIRVGKTFQKRGGNIGSRQHQIRQACFDGAFRQPGVTRFGGILYQSKSARFFDGAQAPGSIGTLAGKQHTGSAITKGGSQRLKTHIDLRTNGTGTVRCADAQTAGANAYHFARRAEVDLVGLDLETI